MGSIRPVPSLRPGNLLLPTVAETIIDVVEEPRLDPQPSTEETSGEDSAVGQLVDDPNMVMVTEDLVVVQEALAEVLVTSSIK